MDLLNILPLDVVLEVFFRLPVHYLGILLQVSAKWNRLLLDSKYDTLFWQEYYQKHFGGILYIPRKIPRKSTIHQLFDSWFCGVQVACSFTKLVNKESQINNNIELPSHDKISLLRIAAQKNDVAMVEILLEHGCDPKVAIDIAREKSNMDLLVLLSPESALKDPSLFTNAIRNRKWKLCLELIKMGVDLTHKACYDVLHFAAICGKKKIVTALLEKKANIESQNWQGFPTLMVAITAKSLSVVKVLLSANANVNFYHSPTKLTPLLSACCTGNMRLVQMLVQAGADLQSISQPFCYQQQSILKLVISNNPNTNLVKYLISLGAMVDFPDMTGQTPLGYCISYSKDLNDQYADMAVLLCNHGANPNLVMRTAIFTGNVKKIQFLINLGATVHPNVPTGHTDVEVPLFTALEIGNMSVIDLMINCGADLTYKKENGWDSLCSLGFHTGPLTYNERISLANRLIDLINVNDPNRDYSKIHILDLASRDNDFKVVKFLREHGAK